MVKISSLICPLFTFVHSSATLTLPIIKTGYSCVLPIKAVPKALIDILFPFKETLTFPKLKFKK